ncbi:hypothetical protein [Cupriavidus necator]
MTAEIPFEECARRVVEALHGDKSLSRLELMEASALTGEQLSRTLRRLKGKGVVGRSSPSTGKATSAVRFELTGLPMEAAAPRPRSKPSPRPQKWESASFDGLLMAWRITLPARVAGQWQARLHAHDCDL